eukprot:gene26828-33469_t
MCMAINWSEISASWTTGLVVLIAVDFFLRPVPYVRQYIRTQRIKLQGYPLVFSYAKIRFQILQVLKGLDVLCGVYGWYLLSAYFNSDWYSMESKLRLMCCAVILVLIFTDVLGSIDPQLIVSDDSEVEEFGLQVTSREIVEEEQRLLAIERDAVLNVLHYKEVTRQDALRAKQRAKHGDQRRIKGSRHAKHNGVAPWNSMADEGTERDLEEGMSAEEEEHSAQEESDSDNDNEEELKHLLSISAYDHIAFTAPTDDNPSFHLPSVSGSGLPFPPHIRQSSGSRIVPFDAYVDKVENTRPVSLTKERKKKKAHSSGHHKAASVLPTVMSPLPRGSGVTSLGGDNVEVYSTLPESTEDDCDASDAPLRLSGATNTFTPQKPHSSSASRGSGVKSRVVVDV